jgi:hypothetical protein
VEPSVENSVYPIIAIVAWLVSARLLIEQIKQPTLQRGFLIAAIGIPGFSYMVAAPKVYHWFDALVGVPNLGAEIVYAGVMTFAWGIVAFVMTVVGGRDYLRRRIGAWTAGYVIAVGAMSVLFVLANVDAVDAEGSTGFDKLYADAPYVPWFLLIFQSYFAIGLVIAGLYCWRWSKQTNRPWMRRGLPFIALASLLILGYIVPKIIYIVLRQFSIHADTLNTWAPLFAVFASLCHLIGFSLCAMGAVSDYRERRRAYQVIYPLWTVLLAPFPDKVLPGSEGPSNPKLAIWPRRLKTLLYRRIVEIRDARLQLRPHFDAGVAAEAKAAAQALGLDELETDAAVEAALLHAALATYSQGNGRDMTPSAVAVVEDADATEAKWFGVGDLAAESRWLKAVAGHWTSLTQAQVAGSAAA